jgi:hypothetical protein
MLRALFPIALALVLALTSVSMAVARGQVAAGERIVICTGAGLVTIEIDAEGNPVGPVHICPDCALGLIAAAATPSVVVARPAPRAADPLPVSAPAALFVQSARSPPVRGPPLAV